MKVEKIRGKIPVVTIMVCSLWIGAFSFTLDAVADEATMYELTVTVVSGHGTVEPNSGSYSEGTVVMLTATPDAAYYVVRQWTGTDDDTSCALTNTVTMDSDKTVTVEFAQPHIITVPGEYPTIQEAIDAAGCGDVVVLNAGVYFEDINFNGKNITVTSANPDDPSVVAYTIIQGTGTGPVVTFSGSESQSCMLDGLTITDGNTTGDGGGICGNGTEATIANCVITNNHADGYGGGVSDCNGTIVRCTITGNTAGSGGGGMSNGSTWYEESSHPRITNCTFIGNRAAHGGGTFNKYSYPTLTNCVFIGNSADGNGGGMYNSSYPRLTNCTFIGNSAEYYGGIWNYPPPPGDGGVSSVGGSSYIVTNNFLSGNIVTNCIIWGNSDSRGMDESAQIGTFGIPLIINYSCVQGWTGGLGGIGNIGEDPLFVDADGIDNIIGTEDDNLRLLLGSPCIDAGDNSVVTVTTDLDDNPRIVNGTVDMGAYEFHGIQTLYVDADAPFGGDGTSWATAFKYLQDALFNVIPAAEIMVAQGIYKPDQGEGITTGDREATFQLMNDVTIKGGYAGLGEPAPDAHDINLYKTILNGDLLGNDIDVNDPRDLLYEPTRVDNSYHVVLTGSGIDASSILDGFTITAGHAKGGYGGGMYNHHSKPTVLNCTFTKNWAEENGGGMFNSGGSPMLVNCKFTFNATSEDDDDEGGSGIFNEGGSPILLDCVFIGNWADFRGGGMYNKYSYPTLTNCTFSKNRAEFGGAIYNYRDDDEEDYSPTLNNCTFSGNSADIGGAMYNWESSITLTNCTFSVNLADDDGGGMYNYYSNPMVTNCIFWGNIDFDGVDETAQIYNHSGAPVINYCCVQGWTGQFGGIGNIGSDPLFVDADGIDNIVGTDDDNLRLLLGSPCIDAGDNSVVTVTTDLDDNPRIVNGTVDMGAYEFQGPFKQYYHVDGVNGDNGNDGLSRETAFETIQFAIDEANDSGTILVWPGVYNETATHGINFKGKAITVKSAADAAVLEVPGFVAVSFLQGENRNSVFSNFVVRGSSTGIFALFSNPTINNVTVVGNNNGIIADNADPLITNCIFWNNTNGDLFGSPDPITAQYSFIQDRIVAYWKLDGNATDSAGSNHGTIYGAAPTTGQIGGALRFDGVDDYVDIPYNSSLDIDASEGITLSVWIKLDSYPDSINQGPIFGLYDSTDAGTKNYLGIAKSVYGNVIGWDQFPPSGGGITSIKPDLDTWYHVVVTEDSIQKAIYINGTLDVSDNIPESYQGNTPDTIRIGNRADGLATFYFDGTIDDVRIYNRALSAEEVEFKYKAGLAGLGCNDPGFVDANGGDYHLLSERGRYRATTDEWILDKVTSPCVDGGDSSVNPSNERMPNGGRINMGAYGNTAYASMSEWPIKGDVNNDGRFNFVDIAILLDGWLQELPWAQ